METAPIDIRGVKKTYPHFTLGAIDLEVSRGRILGLIGPNGAGKSTLLRILMGLVRADAGTVTVLGLGVPADEREVKGRVGFVSEDMALYGGKSLRWHMELVGSVHPSWDAAYACELAGTLALDPDQRMRGMSRGQQVKAMLVLALARRPELLILDEPNAGLDPLVRHELIRLLASSRERHGTIVFSSHHGEDVAALADDVAFLFGGKLIALAPVGEFLSRGKTLEAAFVEHVAIASKGRAA